MHQSPRPRFRNHLNLPSKLSIGLKCAAFIVGTFACFSGNYPPALAQARNAPVTALPVLTVEDAQQDDRIEQLAKRLDATDATASKNGDTLNRLEESIAEFKGEERIVGFLLTLLIGSSIVIQFRAKTK
jgi:hypothetical protein